MADFFATVLAKTGANLIESLVRSSVHAIFTAAYTPEHMKGADPFEPEDELADAA